MNQEINIAELAKKILAAAKRRDPSVIQLEGAYMYVTPGRKWCNVKPVGLEEDQLHSLAIRLIEIGHRAYLYRSGYIEVDVPSNGEIDVIGAPADPSQELLLKSLIANLNVGSVEITAEGMLVRLPVTPIVDWKVTDVTGIMSTLSPIIADPSAGLWDENVWRLLWKFGLEVSGLAAPSKRQITLTWGKERPCSELSAEKNILAQVMDFTRHSPSVLTSYFVSDRELVIRFRKQA